MLDKCKRSCNLCGDLVQQKDRIQPTSKNYRTRRPGNMYTNNIPAQTRSRSSHNDDNILGDRYFGYSPEEKTKETTAKTGKNSLLK